MSWKDTCTQMFIAALFTVAKTWKQPKCPLTGEWIKKMLYIYTMEYYSTIKMNEIMLFEETWVDLEIIILSKVSQKEKDKYHMIFLHAAAAMSLQLCPTLCNPIDSSPSGSTIPGILQARTLEWVAISVSNAWKWKVKVKSLSRVWLFATPWTAAYQAPPSMGFSRQEFWSGVPLPFPILTCRIFKNYIGKLSYKTEIDSQT